MHSDQPDPVRSLYPAIALNEKRSILGQWNRYRNRKGIQNTYFQSNRLLKCDLLKLNVVGIEVDVCIISEPRDIEKFGKQLTI